MSDSEQTLTHTLNETHRVPKTVVACSIGATTPLPPLVEATNEDAKIAALLAEASSLTPPSEAQAGYQQIIDQMGATGKDAPKMDAINSQIAALIAQLPPQQQQLVQQMQTNVTEGKITPEQMAEALGGIFDVQAQKTASEQSTPESLAQNAQLAEAQSTVRQLAADKNTPPNVKQTKFRAIMVKVFKILKTIGLGFGALILSQLFMGSMGAQQQ